jgi:hypothetical protein
MTRVKTERKRHPSQQHRILQIRLGNLMDFMSEMLVLQKNSIRLLSLARDRASSADIRQALEIFCERIEHQSDHLQTAIRDLGGNPVFRSPSAVLQEERLRSLMSLEVPSRLQAVVDLENAWYASVQENLHLAFLRSILPFLDQVHARDLLEDVLESAHDEHEERLDWLEQNLHRMLLRRAIRPIAVEGSGLVRSESDRKAG